MLRFLVLSLAIVWTAPLSAQSSSSPEGQTGETQIPRHEIFAGVGQSAVRERSYATDSREVARRQGRLGNPFGIEIRGAQWWLTTVDDHCIYHGELEGETLTRVAGIGVPGYSGDGGPATQAAFRMPHEVRVDGDGNLFVADTRNHVIRRIDGETGIVETVAGNGTPGFAGDGQSGSEVQFNQPHSVVLDGAGGLLVADTGNHRLRRIDLRSGVVTTVSGNGVHKLPEDRAIAKTSPLFGPRSLAVDDDSIWIALREGNSIWRLDRRTGKLHHIAGTGRKGYSGDGGPPREATFNGPKGLVKDGQGRLLVVDTENHALRRIDLETNRVDTILGGTAAAETFELKRPHGIAYGDGFGYLVGDSEFHRVIHGKP